MYPSLSYWERETFFRNIDVAVIGSGIVGLTAAIHLRERAPGLRVVVIERGTLPLGASTRNAGFACFGSISELLDDRSQRPEAEVWALVARRWQGLKRLRERLGDAAIGYEENGGYELFRATEQATFQRCADHIEPFNRELAHVIGRKDVYKLANAQIPAIGLQGITGLLLNSAEGQIHTGRMMHALWQLARDKGVEIYNGIEITQVETQSDEILLHTDQGWMLHCQQVLAATNGFARRLLPELDVQPARNQVLITEPIPGLQLKGCFHYDRGYYYFRDVEGRILLGGGRNLAPQEEATDQFGTTPLIREALLQLLHEVILPGQKVEVDTWWSGILGIGLEKAPIIKRLNNRLSVSVRMGGMGVAIGSLVGEEGAEVVLTGS
ncbi:MAG: FAD-dependent oxidoreductase [Saprospiraceae bacterium]|nr:FAD-dependent oxidoreductase [Saprospiraceae bacterium]MDZ4705404.1 FAD-dependent oxidoreductase [Saprospiraceae bacterium]